jgi:hypothetical protein
MSALSRLIERSDRFPACLEMLSLAEPAALQAARKPQAACKPVESDGNADAHVVLLTSTFRNSCSALAVPGLIIRRSLVRVQPAPLSPQVRG